MSKRKRRGTEFYHIKNNEGRIVNAFCVDTSVEDTEQAKLRHLKRIGLEDCTVEPISSTVLIDMYLEGMSGIDFNIDLIFIDQLNLYENTEWLNVLISNGTSIEDLKSTLDSLPRIETLTKVLAILNALESYIKSKITISAPKHNTYIVNHLQSKTETLLKGVRTVMSDTSSIEELNKLKKDLYCTVAFASLIIGELSKHGIHSRDEKELRIALGYHITRA